MPFKDPEVQKAYDRKKYERNREKIIERRLQRYAANKEKEAAYQKQYAEKNAEELSAYRKQWKKDRSAKQRKKDRESNSSAQRFYYKTNPEKLLARMKVYYAVKTGKLIRPKHCSRCGVKCRPHGHHPDYSKPLEVVWLCDPCHKIVHLSVS